MEILRVETEWYAAFSLCQRGGGQAGQRMSQVESGRQTRSHRGEVQRLGMLGTSGDFGRRKRHLHDEATRKATEQLAEDGVSSGLHAGAGPGCGGQNVVIERLDRGKIAPGDDVHAVACPGERVGVLDQPGSRSQVAGRNKTDVGRRPAHWSDFQISKW
jgi:hypothetical protein